MWFDSRYKIIRSSQNEHIHFRVKFQILLNYVIVVYCAYFSITMHFFLIIFSFGLAIWAQYEFRPNRIRRKINESFPWHTRLVISSTATKQRNTYARVLRRSRFVTPEKETRRTNQHVARHCSLPLVIITNNNTEKKKNNNNNN